MDICKEQQLRSDCASTQKPVCCLSVITFYNNIRYNTTLDITLSSQKPLGDWVVSAPDFRFRGLVFESHWRRNSSHDCMVLHCLEPFIIILPSSRYNLNNVKRGIKHKSSTSSSTLSNQAQKFLCKFPSSPTHNQLKRGGSSGKHTLIIIE